MVTRRASVRIPQAAWNYPPLRGMYVDYELEPGPPGPVGPAPPNEVVASELGFLASNTAAQNSAAIQAWVNEPDFFGTTFLIDEIAPGGNVFRVDAPIAIPLWRGIRGGGFGVRLKYVGPSLPPGESFIRTLNGGPIFVEDLTLDMHASGIEGLCDYGVQSLGTLVPNVAGATVFLRGVDIQFANVAAYHGLNQSFVADGLATYGGLHGILLEGCSESFVYNGQFSGHEESGVRIRGSGSPGSGLTNGGKFTGYHLIVATAPDVTLPYGVELDGVANCNIYGLTVEGSATASVWFRNKTTNAWIKGFRSNAGTPALFDDSFLCNVEGGCTSTQIPRYVNNARQCMWSGSAESFVAPVDIVQHFGATNWRGVVRSDRRILAFDNVAPTDGFWEVGTIVYARSPAAGQPAAWLCVVAGNPGTWMVIATRPP